MCKKHNALKSHGVIDRIEHRKSEDYSMLRPSIGIDWDDVTAPFNSIAIRMANEKYHPKEPLSHGGNHFLGQRGADFGNQRIL